MKVVDLNSAPLEGEVIVPAARILAATTLTNVERKRGQRLMMQEGAVWSVMNAATAPTSLVITAFALYRLHASDFVIGLLSALPLLAALLQLATPQLLARYGNRKAICVFTLCTARLILLALPVVSLAAWVWPGATSSWLVLLLVILSVFAGFTAIGGTVWLSWSGTVVPLAERAIYFARRNTIVGLVGLVSTFIFGALLDWWLAPDGHTHLLAFTVMFAIAGLFGLITVFLLNHTPDQHSFSQRLDRKVTFAEGLRLTWRHVPLRRFLVFRSVWLFGVGLALPYYTLYMLQNLRLGFTEVATLQNLGALAGLVSFPWWGRQLDRFGCSRVLFWTTWLKVLYVVGWALVGPQGAFWALAFLHLTLVVDSGMNLSAGNLLLNLLPDDTHENITYLSVFTAITSLASAAGPFVGGLLLALLGTSGLNLGGWLNFNTLQIIFLVSGFFRAVSLIFFRGFNDRSVV